MIEYVDGKVSVFGEPVKELCPKLNELVRDYGSAGYDGFAKIATEIANYICEDAKRLSLYANIRGIVEAAEYITLSDEICNLLSSYSELNLHTVKLAKCEAHLNITSAECVVMRDYSPNIRVNTRKLIMFNFISCIDPSLIVNPKCVIYYQGPLIWAKKFPNLIAFYNTGKYASDIERGYSFNTDNYYALTGKQFIYPESFEEVEKMLANLDK